MFTKIKICGIKNADLAYQTAKIGANFIGLIFDNASHRYVNVSQAIDISQAAHAGGAEPVAVFVDASNHEIEKICQLTQIQWIQLHGSQAKAAHKTLPSYLHRIFVMRINKKGQILEEDLQYINQLDLQRDVLLFDNKKGGSGQQIQLNINFNEDPSFKNFNCFISGGLNPNNITQIIQKYRPQGVDVSSGVEINRVKDFNLIQQFITAVLHVSE